MELSHLCTGIKERVALELEQGHEAGARDALLIDALYDVSRVLLPALGPPRKSHEYRQAQEAVLELVSCIAIPLIRGGAERGVAVLSELAEGCQDPLLKKKLSVYAQQLLMKSDSRPRKEPLPDGRTVVLLLATCVLPALLLYLLWPKAAPVGKPPPAALPSVHAGARGAPPSVAPGAPAASMPFGPAAEVRPEPSQPLAQKGEKPAPAAAALPHGEQVTRVRVVNNQVLVPVVLKHGGGTLRLELLLDTGATRTALHEGVAMRLPIDLGSARTALAEVADGRMIRSKIARIDLLSVGPFAHPWLELELIPFSGSDAIHDGLLGMDVLGRHRYQIDMEHEMIRWF